MRNILVVALYPNESCPVFSLQLAKALIVNGYSVYAILPADIDNKSELTMPPKNFEPFYFKIIVFLFFFNV